MENEFKNVKSHSVSREDICLFCRSNKIAVELLCRAGCLFILLVNILDIPRPGAGLFLRAAASEVTSSKWWGGAKEGARFRVQNSTSPSLPCARKYCVRPMFLERSVVQWNQSDPSVMNSANICPFKINNGSFEKSKYRNY